MDFAPVGHAQLHLNLRPSFGVPDALQNLHRLDVSLLDGLMTIAKDGLHLLAGPPQPYPSMPTPAELARLFDLLVNHYRYVVVDASSRLDSTTRLLSDLSNAVLMVAQTDVVSLWSASRIHAFLEEGTGRNRLRLVLNRYKKIPGFTEEDVEQATRCKVLWKIPNAYQAVSPAIDHGTPGGSAGSGSKPRLPRAGSGVGRGHSHRRRRARSRLCARKSGQQEENPWPLGDNSCPRRPVGQYRVARTRTKPTI